MRKRLRPVLLLFFLGSAHAASQWDLECTPPLAGATLAVPSAAAAIAGAKYAWGVSRYPLSAQDIARFEPYHAELQDGEWHVYGSPDGGHGTPEAFVCQKNGRTEVLQWPK